MKNNKLYTTIPLDKRYLGWKETLTYEEQHEVRDRIEELKKLTNSPNYKLQVDTVKKILVKIDKPNITLKKLERLLSDDYDNRRPSKPCGPYSEGM